MDLVLLRISGLLFFLSPQPQLHRTTQTRAGILLPPLAPWLASVTCRFGKLVTFILNHGFSPVWTFGGPSYHILYGAYTSVGNKLFTCGVRRLQVRHGSVPGWVDLAME